MSKIIIVDGCNAAARAAYAFSEVAAIYPITPSSVMAETVDEWSARGKTNVFGQRVRVVEMQSEAGAAGAMHGALESGALAVTFTASQGLLLMIPNIYKMVGELLPGVLHVSARAIATHALSIFGDHQDVMACRQTGVPILASSNAQEAFDLGCVAHLSAISSRLPFLHFFDGFRTSHELLKIEEINYSDLAGIVDKKALTAFRGRALNPLSPLIKGTAQNPDIYFQGREAQNRFFDAVPDITAGYMQNIGEITGRQYRPFDYYGAADGEYVIVAMASVCDTVKEVVDFLNARGKKTGLLQVRLYRPFSSSYFFRAMPASVKRIAVLDRTKEPGAPGEPLYLDVSRIYAGIANPPQIFGGRYGLGSKDVTPRQILAVFNNLKTDRPQNGFTIGIKDDVTHLSLTESEEYESVDNMTLSCKFWGLGSDGTVGANKSACKIIGENTDLNVQAYFYYDSKKSGGATISHLRFGKNKIYAPYLIYNADYIACHNKSFLNHFDLIKGIKRGGTFVLNCDFTPEELSQELPSDLKRALAENDIRFYIINAEKIASQIGLGNRINMVMQSAFFKLTGVIPITDAAELLKREIERAYGRKGKAIVEMNKKAVDRGLDALVEINVPKDWANLPVQSAANPESLPEFVENVQRVMARNEGDSLPVSAFKGMEDGGFPPGTTAFEKRGIAPVLPEWQPEKCIQCGFCSFICPHATIRMFLLDENESVRAPSSLKTIKATGKKLEGYKLRVQVSPLDCTGCSNCADICPAKGKALIMKPAQPQIEAEHENWEYMLTLAEKPSLAGRNTIKGSQFLRPLLEFNGACPGCGETPYIRLLTQLFGERMMIANATGCSSIWAASAPSIAYTVNSEGRGPAWANSLFEDNAEYGYGMCLGVGHARKRLFELVGAALEKADEKLKALFEKWLANSGDGDRTLALYKKILNELKNADLSDPLLREICEKSDFFVKRSIWSIGGDGWAYDIGYGGVDHVLSTNEDINLFVMDTEVYSNTGGQASKSTPSGAVAKFAFDGKQTRKKDLGLMAITYGSVYVAQIAMGADMNQTLKAILEAESYPGPSLIIAYSPCISHGIKTGISTSLHEEKKAVDSGYWHLYRYDPRRRERGENPFILDSKEPSESYLSFLEGELRFGQLKNTFPEKADALFALSEKHARERYQRYKRLAGK